MERVACREGSVGTRHGGGDGPPTRAGQASKVAQGGEARRSSVVAAGTGSREAGAGSREAGAS